MEKEKITTGTISEKELVELFGTPSAKKSYEENNHFVSRWKKKTLDRASRCCLITDNGNRTYKIESVYEYQIPSQFSKMNKSLYQYITPLILDILTKGHDENNKITLTIGKWAREINMVNHNYNLVKYNKEGTSKSIAYELEIINDFYNRSDDMIERYITKTLDYLKSSGHIIWREVYYILQEHSVNTDTINTDGNIVVDIQLEQHLASDKEMEFYSKCIKIADEKANIKNASERYYSKKSKLWNRVLKEELYTRKIKLVYKAYQAYYINLDKCKNLLKLFNNYNNIKLLVDKFTQEFSDMLVDNAVNRYDKNPAKYRVYQDKEDCMLCFSGLCDMVINPKTEYLKERIEKLGMATDYTIEVNHIKKYETLKTQDDVIMNSENKEKRKIHNYGI